MDRKGRQSNTAFQDKFYYDYPSYKKEERRDGRAKIRRSDSGRSRREVSRPREKEVRPTTVKRGTRERQDNWSHQAPQQRFWSDREDSQGWRQTTDRRRWAWATQGDFDVINRNQQQSIRQRNDYVDMSSMETSSSSDSSSITTVSPPRRSGRSQALGYHKIYVRHPQAISRSRSISRPSPPRAKSVGNFPVQPSRAQSFTSIYESRSVDTRPLRTSLSSHGIFFTETGHLPRYSTTSEAPLSMSLQDLQTTRMSHQPPHKVGRSLLDLSNVTINDSEIDKDEALLIISISKRAVELCGELSGPGYHGKVASLIKDKVEKEMGLGGWQCVVGQRGAFGCCLSPAPNQYFNFDLTTITVLMFKAT